MGLEEDDFSFFLIEDRVWIDTDLIPKSIARKLKDVDTGVIESFLYINNAWHCEVRIDKDGGIPLIVEVVESALTKI